MKPWLLWLSIVGLLLLAVFTKVGVRVTYRDAFTIKFQVGKFRFTLPEKKTETVEDKTPSKSVSAKKKKRDWKPLLSAMFENRSEILALVGRILTTPTLDALHVHIEVGADEPDQCALKYGQICGLVGAILGAIENTFTVKKRKVDVRCCFDRSDIRIEADIEVTLRVYEIIALAMVALRIAAGLYRQGKSNKKVV